MKALVVRLSSIGDVVHTLPAAAVLRERGVRIAWLVEPAARELIEDNPAVDECHVAPAARRFSWSEAARTLRALRAAPADVALDFQGLWKSAAWARLAGAPRVLGYARPWRREPASSWLLRERLEQAPPGAHVIDKHLGLLQPLGIDAVGRREVPLPSLERAQAAAAAGLARLGMGDDFVLLNPGGGWQSKLWPAERFAELALALRARGFPSLVAWGPGEEPLARSIEQRSQGAARRALPTTLLDLAALSRLARVTVAADTGPLHLACAAGARVVGLYGPTDPQRNGPWGAASRVVARRPACFPCHRRHCTTHAGVLASIPVDEVLARVEEHLAQSTGAPHVAV